MITLGINLSIVDIPTDMVSGSLPPAEMDYFTLTELQNYNLSEGQYFTLEE